MHLLKSVAPDIIPATSNVKTLGAYIIGPRVAWTCSCTKDSRPGIYAWQKKKISNCTVICR